MYFLLFLVTFQCYSLLSEFCLKEGISKNLKSSRPRQSCPFFLWVWKNRKPEFLISCLYWLILSTVSEKWQKYSINTWSEVRYQLQNPVVILFFSIWDFFFKFSLIIVFETKWKSRCSYSRLHRFKSQICQDLIFNVSLPQFLLQGVTEVILRSYWIFSNFLQHRYEIS